MPCHHLTKKLHNFNYEFCPILRTVFKHQSVQSSPHTYNFWSPTLSRQSSWHPEILEGNKEGEEGMEDFIFLKD